MVNMLNVGDMVRKAAGRHVSTKYVAKMVEWLETEIVKQVTSDEAAITDGGNGERTLLARHFQWRD